MRVLLFAAVFCACMAVPCPAEDAARVVTSAATLRWARQPDSAGFLVQVYNDGKMVQSHQVGDPEVKLKEVLGKLIPGEYRLRIVAIGPGGGLSQPSAPLAIIWIGPGLV